MKCGLGWWKFFLLAGSILLALPSLTSAQNYQQTNLVSNIPGAAPVMDPNLQNAWGLTRSAGSPWWVANNNSGTSTLYSISQTSTGLAAAIVSLPPNGFVTVPPPAFEPTAAATPTGVVFNGSATDFLLSTGKSAHFIFDTEDGTISAWAGGAEAELEVDNSQNGGPNGAVYKGLTSGELNGNKYLYATNFRSGRVEIYDTHFKRVHFGHDAFNPNAGCDDDDHGDRDHRDDRDHHDRHGDCDDRVPDGYAPFNVQNIGDNLFVTYAQQDAPRHDPVGGSGFGYVKIFTLDGHLVGHLQHGDWMNAPWGVVWTTRDWGTFSNSILVGNFRSGWIAAFDGFTYQFKGFVENPDNSLMFIDGIWSLTFGNDASAGPADTMFFTAGPNDETNGLFGTITPTDGTDGTNE